MPLDRVFGPERCTKEVYDQGAKEVALSVVSGVHGKACLLLLSSLLSTVAHVCYKCHLVSS